MKITIAVNWEPAEIFASNPNETFEYAQETATQAARELAEKFDGYQGTTAIHTVSVRRD